MKKFLKWSAAFLVLGVLAVGCIKNEPSPGIEAMRDAKAALLLAQADLTKAKIQVEAANAAFTLAQASYLKAQEAVVAATARKIDAETALIMAQVEWEKALTAFHKEAWALRIAELEIELEVIRAEADAAIAAWELIVAQLQADMVRAMQDYEAALLAFEQWKIENADTLGQALLAKLNDIVFQIQMVILDMAQANINLNFAKAAYHWYVNVVYPEDVERVLLYMQAEKMRLECLIEYLFSVAEAYEAIYNEYHGEFDEMIAEFQEVINGLRVQIAEAEIAFIQLQKEWLEFDHAALEAANRALARVRTVTIPNVFSDGGDDPNIHVFNGTYRIRAPWTGANSMFNMMERDMRVIEDTRVEFEDQDSGVIERNIAAKKKQSDDAAARYIKNWNDWQKYYQEARISGSHVGIRYTTWVNAWNDWNTAMINFNAHSKIYGDMYERAQFLIGEYMYYLNGILDAEKEGLLVLPGGATLSQVLGGIYFDAANLATYIFGPSGKDFLDVINAIFVMLEIPGKMDAIVTELKAIMDGTHAEGWPAFWDHATAWTYTTKPLPPPYGDIMRAVYDKSNREITDMSKEEWTTWLFLYWLFQKRTVEIGLEGAGTVITINVAQYTDAAPVVLEDFFGELDRAEYRSYMVGVSTKPIENAINIYYDAVEGLGNLERAMFRPFHREWRAKKNVFDSKGKVIGNIDWSRTEALADVTEKPAITHIYSIPSQYNPPVYDDAPHWNETQPRPVDANDFFFVLEGRDKLGRTVVSPSLDFDITYLNEVCDLYVSYAALLNAGEDCGDQWSQWAGDLPLWLWSERDGYGLGHYFYAIWQARDYQAYQDTYNRVINGEYAALIDKIQALYDAQRALYLEVRDRRDALQDELDAIEEALLTLGGYYDSVNGVWVLGLVEIYELWIDEYQWLIDQAIWAHNEGNLAWEWYWEDGLLAAWLRAKDNLLEAQQALRRINEAFALYEQGLPMPDLIFWGNVIENETLLYQAKIDFWLLEIGKLQNELTVLEGIRAKLLEDYL